MSRHAPETPPAIDLAIRGRLLSFEVDTLGAPAGEGMSCARIVEDGLILVGGGRILALGEAPAMLRELPESVPLADHRPHLVLPGFIDPHLHMPQTQVIASYGAELMEWLAKYTFPEESRYGDPAVAAAAARFLLDELLSNGTTTAAVYCTTHPVSVDAFFAEALGRDLRMVAGKVMMDRNAPPALLDTPQTGVEQSEALIARWHGRGRLGYAITPRFAPTSTDAQLEATAALARAYPALAVQTHLSENRGEIDFVAELFPWSRDYTDVYERHGLVRGKALFGHCIHLSQREWRAMGEGGATAVFCPTSNLFLGSGLFDLASARASGVRVGLATDIGGGTSYSMLRTAAEAYKVLKLRGQTLHPAHAFAMMTAGNAAAMGLEAHVGRLAPGLEADVVVLDAQATPALRRRMERVETLAEELFALLVLGDERATVATYAAGRRLYDRRSGAARPAGAAPSLMPAALALAPASGEAAASAQQ